MSMTSVFNLKAMRSGLASAGRARSTPVLLAGIAGLRRLRQMSLRRSRAARRSSWRPAMMLRWTRSSGVDRGPGVAIALIDSAAGPSRFDSNPARRDRQAG